MSANRNKESLVLDLKSDDDKDVLARLVERADVLMENFRVGVLDRLGFPVDAAARAEPAAGRAVDHRLRPRRPGGDARGLRPDRAGRGRADVDHRHRAADQGRRADRRPDRRDVRRVRRASPRCTSASATGRGRVVRTSLLAGMVGVHAYQGTRWTVAGEVPGLAGDHHPSIAPYGMFATATAPVQIACGSEGLWRALCAAFGWDAAEAGFATNARAGGQPRRADRADRGAVRRPSPPSTGSSCSPTAGVPVGQGALDGRRLHLGPDPLAGPAARRRARDPGPLDLPGSPIRFDDNPFSGGRSDAPRSPDARPARRVDPGVAGLVRRTGTPGTTQYDDPASSLSRGSTPCGRSCARCSSRRPGRSGWSASAPATAATPCRCSRETGADVDAVLVELDPELAERGRPRGELGLPGSRSARPTRATDGVVRRRRAGRRAPGLRCVRQHHRRRHRPHRRHAADAAGHRWSRRSGPAATGCRRTPRRTTATRASWSGRCSPRRGFDEVAFVRPTTPAFRVGVHRWPGPAGSPDPGVRMFTASSDARSESARSSSQRAALTARMGVAGPRVGLSPVRR